MKTRPVLFVLLTATVVGLLTAEPPSARSQATGRIYLTKQQVPTDLKGRALRKALRKQSTRALKKEVTADGWTAYGMAKLRTRPSKKLMKLALNGGKIQIIIKRRVKRRWTRTQIGSFVYDKRVRIVRFEVSLSEDNKLPMKVKHRLQLVVQNRKKRDIVLASTTLSLR